MPKSKKRLRGSRGWFRQFNSATKANCDLMVVMPPPKSLGNVERQLILKEVTQRLLKLNYTHMALTHTIYGRPKPDFDMADVAIPDSLIETLRNTKNDGASSTGTKKRKRSSQEDHASAKSSTNSTSNSMTILRRLHVVLENLSDVNVYNTKDTPYLELLNGYDIISIAPTNDATFAAICNLLKSNQCMADILTVDYHSSGKLRLGYRIGSGNMMGILHSNNVALEFCMAPSILNLKSRKALIQACREVQMASVGKERKLPILLSSGDRRRRPEGSFKGNDDDDNDDSDVGALAMHSAGDLINLCKVVMQFDPYVADKSMGGTALRVIERGKDRRLGKVAAKSMVESVKIMIGDDFKEDVPERDDVDGNNDFDGSVANEMDLTQEDTRGSTMQSKGEEDDDDGFMAL